MDPIQSLRAAQAALMSGDTTGAYQRIQGLTDAQPNFPDAWRMKAELEESLQRPIDAINSLNTLASLLPNDLEAWRSLTRLYQAVGQVESAKSAAARVLSLDPTDTMAKSLGEGIAPMAIPPVPQGYYPRDLQAMSPTRTDLPKWVTPATLAMTGLAFAVWLFSLRVIGPIFTEAMKDAESGKARSSAELQAAMSTTDQGLLGVALLLQFVFMAYIIAAGAILKLKPWVYLATGLPLMCCALAPYCSPSWIVLPIFLLLARNPSMRA